MKILLLLLLIACGTDGKNGTDGTDGTTGEQGTAGEQGTNGTTGAAGAEGADGKSGTDGTNGENGEDGGKIVKFIYCSAQIPIWISSASPSFVGVTWEAKITNSGDLFVTGGHKFETSLKATLTNATYAAGQLELIQVLKQADRHVDVGYDAVSDKLSADFEFPSHMEPGLLEDNTCQTLTF